VLAVLAPAPQPVRPTVLPIAQRVSVQLRLLEQLEWFNGVVVGHRQKRGKIQHHIKYDDNEMAWDELLPCQFRRLQPRFCDSILPQGARLAVHWLVRDEPAWFNGVVVGHRQKRGETQHHIKYDDGDLEWEVLLQGEFHRLPSLTQVSVGASLLRLSCLDALENDGSELAPAHALRLRSNVMVVRLQTKEPHHGTIHRWDPTLR
jgi:hypothetical protein